MKLSILEYLDQLPEPYRGRALHNCNPNYIGYRAYVENISVAVTRAFDWHQSPQGDKYWRDFWVKLQSSGIILPYAKYLKK